MDLFRKKSEVISKNSTGEFFPVHTFRTRKDPKFINKNFISFVVNATNEASVFFNDGSNLTILKDSYQEVKEAMGQKGIKGLFHKKLYDGGTITYEATINADSIVYFDEKSTYMAINGVLDTDVWVTIDMEALKERMKHGND